MKKTLGEIATYIEAALEGDPSIEITGVNNIEGAMPGDITFAVQPHIDEAKKTLASAVVLPEDEAAGFPLPSLRAKDPRAAFAKLVELFVPKLELPIGISPEAHVGKDVSIGKDVTILPLAVVDDHAVIGDRAILYPHSYVGQYSEVGEDSIVYSSAVIREHCRIGKRCIIHACAVIGTDGFGFTTEHGVHTKVPQVGGVLIEDDVEVGSHVGIDRAAMGMTVIGEGTKIDNLVHIGHNCRIGKHCIIVAQTGISGSTTVGDHVTFGGQVGTVGHIKIGGNSVYAARSGITNDMPEGVFCAGFPLQTHAEWLRTQVAYKRLPQMVKQIRQLEKKLKELEKNTK